MKRRYFFIFFILLLVIKACDEPDCASELSDTLKLSFYKGEENELDTVFVRRLSVLDQDSVLLQDTLEVSRISLPVNPNTNSVTYVFHTVEYGLDTIEISYKNGVRLISEDCGVELIYSDLDYLKSNFDSVRIVNNVLADAIEENIRVYND